MLLPLTVPSLVTAFVGGLLVLGGQVCFILTGVLLIAAAVLMVFKRTTDTGESQRVRLVPTVAVGAGAGFISGLTGVGGGVFLTPLLIAFGWASPRRAAALSPPFIRNRGKSPGGGYAVCPRQRMRSAKLGTLG
jgi:uncharacterized protein